MARREDTARGSCVAAGLVKPASGTPVSSERVPMQREPKRAKRTVLPPLRDPPIAPMAYSIKQFCQAHDISVDTYFRMQRVGYGPVTMKVGGRTLISIEAAAAWRRERETDTNTRPVVAAE